MRYLISIILAILIVVPQGYAKKKRSKAGKISDNIYKDIKYNFQFELPENWNRKVQKEKSNLRLILSQKDPKVPDELMMTPDYAMIPSFFIYINESPLDPFEFIDSMVSETYKSKIKDDIYMDLIPDDENIKFNGIKTAKIRKVTLDEKTGINWLGTASFTFESGSQKKNFTYTTFCISVKKENDLLLFMGQCETQFGEEISGILLKMANSLKW
jgi:hypothetical protein